MVVSPGTTSGSESRQFNNDYDSATRKPKTPDASSCALSEILSGHGLASLGEVLDLMDLAAGRCAYRHVEGPVVTRSLEDVILQSPLPRGVHIRVTATPLYAGTSSLLLKVVAEAEDACTRTFHKVIDARVTFVAVNRETGAPKKVVPALHAHDARYASMENDRLRAMRTKYARAKWDAGMYSRSKSSVMVNNGMKEEMEIVRVKDGQVEIRKQYLPRHENFSRMVFGGDLLETLERIAVYCGKRLVRAKSNVRCIGMKYFAFVKPIKPMNLLCVTARPVWTNGAMIIVQVDAAIDNSHEGDGLVLANDGLFALLCSDDLGMPVHTGVSIAFDEETSESAKNAHARALMWTQEETLNERVLVSGKDGVNNVHG